MFKLRKALFIVYKVCFAKILGIIITLGDMVISFPISMFASFKTKKPLPPITDELLLQAASILAKRIREKEITSEKLVETFIARIKEVNPILNAVVEDRFLTAIEEAKQIDCVIKKDIYTVTELETKYPLFGVPITIKESLAVEGMSHNAGMICSRGKASEDADVVKKIKQAGAIVLAVTNTPELCLDWECYNKITGRTSNPYDNRRTSGASSGGEAALIASAASVIGLGSDALGSLRLPAHFCGIFSHKPTGLSVSIEGHLPISEEEVYRKVVCAGPMSRYSSDLPLLMRIICKDERREVLDLDRKVDFSRLTMFYIEDWDSELTHSVTSEIKQSIHETLRHFHKTYETKIRKWEHPELFRTTERCLVSLISMTGVTDIFENDPTKSPVMELIRFALGLSNHTFYPICYLLLCRYLPIYDVQKIKNKVEAAEKIVSNALGENGVIICPTFPVDAPFHRALFTKSYDNVYMSVFNSLGFPATVAPVGFSKKGLPFGLQIVGRPYSDRLTMAIAQEIEKAFGGWKAPELVT
ncbi:hypothetical protein Trydic_g21594 [Trypoxylus dichotomus]